MRRTTLLVAAALLSICATAATAGAAPRQTPAPTAFSDPVGDAGTAADLSKVTVGNDASGNYTFDLVFNSPLSSTDTVAVYLDTDANPSTGDPNASGAEYALLQYEADRTYGFAKWNGSSWGQAPGTANVVRVSDTELTISVARADLDNTGSFNFWVDSWDGNGGAGHEDIAPDGTGTWSYSFQAPLVLSVLASRTTAAKVGRPWVLAIVVGRSDTGGTVGSEGTITCSARGGGRALKLETNAFVSTNGANVAVCAFAVSKKLKHKLVHGTITVTYQGLSVSRSFSARVK